MKMIMEYVNKCIIKILHVNTKGVNFKYNICISFIMKFMSSQGY